MRRARFDLSEQGLVSLSNQNLQQGSSLCGGMKADYSTGIGS